MSTNRKKGKKGSARGAEAKHVNWMAVFDTKEEQSFSGKMDDGGSDSAMLGGGAHTANTSSLDALQSKDSRKVMDIVDKLRRTGLGGEVQLPQLVVSGDQSSGKSSVLEAITEIPFPRKENLCTRFATEIVLRRAATPSISTKIIPDKLRPAMEKKRLESFKSTIMDFTELPTLMEEATNMMGLGDDGTGPARAFSRDVLSIDIAGPNRPHLTLVDLPGLIHAENKMQSKEDVELIKSLVDDYINEKRTIIMAVVSAKNDYANQIILKMCRDVDPKGRRTIGIITKPDFLEPGSENEQSWIELAENKDIFFELGWHMLRNRSDKEATKSFAERNSAESAFFSQGRYRDLSPEMVGIDALRSRLSQLLYKHLKTELPALQKELNDKHRSVCHELELLGEKRSTVHEQRRFLLNISTAYQDIVRAAVNGQYEHEFFGTLDTDEALDHETNMRRLRAVVQHLNMQFASTMRQFGHTKKIEIAGDEPGATDVDVSVEPPLDEAYAEFGGLQQETTRADEVERVRKILVRSRGSELPGAFNPLVISRLFWDQSVNWKAIADFHIDKVAGLCATLVIDAIKAVASDDVAGRLQTMKAERALSEMLAGAKAELDRIIGDTKLHPVTYDPAYTAAVAQMRYEKQSKRLKSLVQQASVNVPNAYNAGNPQYYLKPDVINSGIESLREVDTDKAAAEDALDSEQAYYKDEVKYFINAITKQIIERCLLRDLAPNTISPMVIGDMTDDEVAFIAAEPEETTRMRDNLEARKATLEKGQATLKGALGMFK